jgi:uncharacterized protein YcaQ
VANALVDLSLRDARAIALAAQQLAQPRPERVERRQLRALLATLGVIQIDSVNVLVRSHYLPAFSRLGAYDPADLDALAHRAPRAAFEYWGHEASLLPVALHPLLRWRMARAHEHAWGGMRRIARTKPGFVADILAIVRDKGPISASELEHGPPKRKSGWWEWSDAKRAIEWLFWSGEVTSARRRGFERLYDLPERVLPARVLDAATPSEHDAHRALLEIAARAHGVATEADLRDYYRLPLAGARAALHELVEDGSLVPVRVEGWAKPAYMPRRAAPPVAIDRTRAALLSPFDALIWFRDRAERMFGMKYRIEIYTPAPKRVHGYYVLPLLLGDALVARVELKADRAANALRVQAAHLEPDARVARVVPALAGELRRMAAWLGLERVEVMQRGDLAKPLNDVMTRARSRRRPS